MGKWREEPTLMRLEGEAGAQHASGRASTDCWQSRRGSARGLDRSQWLCGAQDGGQVLQGHRGDGASENCPLSRWFSSPPPASPLPHAPSLLIRVSPPRGKGEKTGLGATPSAVYRLCSYLTFPSSSSGEMGCTWAPYVP